MVSDAYVQFTCDECGTTEDVTLPVVYSGYSGSDPHADLRDSAVAKSLPDGWRIEGDKHYCESCDPV